MTLSTPRPQTSPGPLRPLLALAIALLAWLAAPPAAVAQVHAHPDENGAPVVRSLEACGTSTTEAGRWWPTGRASPVGR